MPFKILLITPWPLDTAGGTQTLVRNLAAELSRQPGLEITVVTGAMPGEKTLRLPQPPYREIRLPLVNQPRPAWMPRPWRIVGGSYLMGLDDLAAEIGPDCLLYAPHHSSQAHQAAHVAERLGVPFLFWPLIHLEYRRHVNRTAARLYRSAALIVCSSDLERRWLTMRAGVPAERTLMLGCGSAAAARADPAVRAPGTGECIKLLSVGEFARHKRFSDQIEALALLRAAGIEAELTLAGVMREGRVFADIQSLARKHGLARRVSLLPNVAEAELWPLYPRAHYFLFTSASESFGLALLDALCSGTFAITYPHPIYRTLVESSGFGRVATRETPRALAEAIASAVAAGEPLARGPTERWLDEHSWGHIAGILGERLQQLPR